MDGIGRIVGFSRGMRGNKRGARRKKTYTRKGNGRIVGLLRGMRGNKRETRRKKTYAS